MQLILNACALCRLFLLQNLKFYIFEKFCISFFQIDIFEGFSCHQCESEITFLVCYLFAAKTGNRDQQLLEQLSHTSSERRTDGVMPGARVELQS